MSSTPTSTTLPGLLLRGAREQPGRPLLICDDRVVDWGTFEARSTWIARALQARGVNPGDRVALLFRNGFEMPLCLMACWKAGAIAVPVNPRLAPPEAAFVLAHSEARLLVGEQALVDRLEASALPGTVVRVSAPEGTAGGVELESSLGGVPETGSAALPAVSAEAPALIIFTSGSTARPKGVVHTHRSLAASALVKFEAFAPAERFCVMTPIYHVSGLWMWSRAVALGRGAVVIRDFEPGLVLDAMERHACDLTVGLPLMYQALLAAQSVRPRRLPARVRWLAGGDAVTEALQEQWRTAFADPLWEGFAMTEVVPAIINPEGNIRPGWMGVPCPGTEVRIRRLDGGLASDDEVGELEIRAWHLFAGYWKDPAGTAAVLRDGWFATGDLALRAADGWLRFAGRLKHLIVRGGTKISPPEVESVLVEHPAVAEVAVVGRPDPVFGETVAAFVVLRAGAACSEQSLTQYAASRLAGYKVPETVRFLDALPRGPTGKADRRRLREQLRAV